MSRDAIFLVQGDELVELTSEAYRSEELLQHLLARYPDLLAGGQMDEQSPRRWLLIDRELGVPAEEQGGSRFAVDHLFIDQDGVPTIVEVKRSSDTRLRRGKTLTKRHQIVTTDSLIQSWESFRLDVWDRHVEARTRAAELLREQRNAGDAPSDVEYTTDA